jgi:hypothetical protein
MTNAGYAFVDDNPLDGTDPTGQLGMCGYPETSCGYTPNGQPISDKEPPNNAPSCSAACQAQESFDTSSAVNYNEAAGLDALPVLNHSPRNILDAENVLAGYQDALPSLMNYVQIIEYRVVNGIAPLATRGCSLSCIGHAIGHSVRAGLHWAACPLEGFLPWGPGRGGEGSAVVAAGSASIALGADLLK